MTDYRPPWVPRPLADLAGIPVCLDPEVPASTVALDVDPDEPRHITRIRIHNQNDMRVNRVNRVEFAALTDAQVEQIRGHYRAMDERAGQLLAEWQQLAARAGLDTR